MVHLQTKEDGLINAALTASQYNTDEDEDLDALPASSENLCSEDLDPTDLEAEKLRKKIQFFLMNPIQKWQTKQRFPYKFVVQLIKIVLVTLQLCLFAHNRYLHVNYMRDNRVTFSHLFLMGWDPSREVNDYPPGSGPLALYKIPEFFDTIDYAVDGYGKLNDAIGPYAYPEEENKMSPMQLCMTHYKVGTIFAFNESYFFDNEIVVNCVMLNVTRETMSNFSSRDYLREKGISVQFSSLIESTLSFGVKTVNFQSAGPITPPDCYKFNITIYFDNKDQDGQMKYSLDAETIRLRCKGDMEYKADNHLYKIYHSILNSLVIAICSISLILCSRAIYRAQLLKRETISFFRRVYRKDVSLEGRLEFLNFWYIMIIVNDALIIFGSSIKQQIEMDFTGDEWNFCSVLLGTGNMLVWFGILRYLGFFKTYNVVILTLKKATPKLARFLLCALLIYSGFSFAGWVILGPYHMKFRSLSTTSECLFSLVNGDDMFATFSTMEAGKSPLLWWYARIYLYVFICLYIYVIISLFISVIIDAYETIKLYYKVGFPKNDIQEFVQESHHNNSTVPLRNESSSSLEDALELCRRSNFKRVLTKMCCGGNSKNVPHQEIGIM